MNGSPKHPSEQNSLSVLLSPILLIQSLSTIVVITEGKNVDKPINQQLFMLNSHTFVQTLSWPGEGTPHFSVWGTWIGFKQLILFKDTSHLVAHSPPRAGGHCSRKCAHWLCLEILFTIFILKKNVDKGEPCQSPTPPRNESYLLLAKQSKPSLLLNRVNSRHLHMFQAYLKQRVVESDFQLC